jgi:hypothetical protein
MDFGQHGAGRSGIQAHGVSGRNFNRKERKKWGEALSRRSLGEG